MVSRVASVLWLYPSYLHPHSSAFDATARRSSPAPAVLAYICSDSNFTLREAPLSIKSFLCTLVYSYIFLPRSLLAVQPLSDLQPAPGCCCPGGADDVERNFWGGEDTIKPGAASLGWIGLDYANLLLLLLLLLTFLAGLFRLPATSSANSGHHHAVFTFQFKLMETVLGIVSVLFSKACLLQKATTHDQIRLM